MSLPPSLPDSQALASIRADRGKANDGLSSALLVVFLDSARNLPVSTRAKANPKMRWTFFDCCFLEEKTFLLSLLFTS